MSFRLKHNIPISIFVLVFFILNNLRKTILKSSCIFKNIGNVSEVRVFVLAFAVMYTRVININLSRTKDYEFEYSSRQLQAFESMRLLIFRIRKRVWYINIYSLPTLSFSAPYIGSLSAWHFNLIFLLHFNIFSEDTHLVVVLQHSEIAKNNIIHFVRYSCIDANYINWPSCTKIVFDLYRLGLKSVWTTFHTKRSYHFLKLRQRPVYIVIKV